MNENKCPYCHETADECESVKLLFIDEKFKKSTYDYVAQAWIWLDRLHFEVIVPMLDYHIPRFEFFKNIKIKYCPMCGRNLMEEKIMVNLEASQTELVPQETKNANS